MAPEPRVPVPHTRYPSTPYEHSYGSGPRQGRETMAMQNSEGITAVEEEEENSLEPTVAQLDPGI